MIEEITKVLLVDDDEDIHGLIKAFLKDMALEITSAFTGEEALEKLKKETYQIVLSDLEMPGLSGLELLEKAKNYDSNTEVIMITAHSDLEKVRTAMRSGAYDYLEKPVNKLDLTNAVTHLKEQIQLRKGLLEYQANLEAEKRKSDDLLRQLLPDHIADELKEKGKVEPRIHAAATVMFIDFVGFTKFCESNEPDVVLSILDQCFSQFDQVMLKNNLDKLKTLGDGYMCAGGLEENHVHNAIDMGLAAIEIRSFFNQIKSIRTRMKQEFWEIRMGINTGKMISGVIGTERFTYDVWGDSVNVAARMESSGQPAEINISESTYNAVKEYLKCKYRGKLVAKNKGEMKMYFLERILPEYSQDEEGNVPNKKLLDILNAR